LLSSCCDFQESTLNSDIEQGWERLDRVSKKINNITYIFPADVSIKDREKAIKMSEASIKENLELLGETEFKDTIKFEFLHTRKEMKLATGLPVKGLAIPRKDAMYSLLDLSETSPIKHELMHMILALNWHHPYKSMQWFNEGLATYSGKMCGKENFDELYYYYLTHELLIPIEHLVDDFYGQDEIIGYSQGAFIVKYLSNNYGWEKMKKLWLGGFSQFENIFGSSYESIQNEMHESLKTRFPNGVELDWEHIKQGCP